MAAPWPCRIVHCWKSDATLLYKAGELAWPVGQSASQKHYCVYYQSPLGEAKDLYSTNAQDAGLRVVLPGAVGSNNLYHVRVRSSNLKAGDPAIRNCSTLPNCMMV